MGKLYGGRVPQVCHGTQEYFRDVYDHLGRINQTIDGIRDSVTTAMAVSLSLIQLQENEMTKRLAAYAALVAMPTMIAGVYGMNFEHMPELKWTFGYPLAIGAMVAIDALSLLRFRQGGLAVATRPDARGYSATAFASSRPRASPGARPVQRRKARLKLDASAKPRR